MFDYVCYNRLGNVWYQIGYLYLDELTGESETNCPNDQLIESEWMGTNGPSDLYNDMSQ